MDLKVKGGFEMKWIMRLLYLLVFIASITLIITEQQNIGLSGLFNMLIGLAGILILIYLYNRRYQ